MCLVFERCSGLDMIVLLLRNPGNKNLANQLVLVSDLTCMDVRRMVGIRSFQNEGLVRYLVII